MLTQKQENFTNDLFAGVPQGQAYKNNYNTQNMLQPTIDRNAHALAGNNKIATRLEEMRQAAKAPLIADFQERQEILTEIVRGKVVDFVDAKGHITLDAPNNRALQEVTVVETSIGKDEPLFIETKKVKLHSPLTAIAELNRMDGAYPPERVAILTDINVKFTIGEGFEKIDDNQNERS